MQAVGRFLIESLFRRQHGGRHFLQALMLDRSEGVSDAHIALGEGGVRNDHFVTDHDYILKQ